MIPISEIFYSIQGEWRNTWKPSIFIRFRGCNLKCWYCDTPYAVIDNTDLKEEYLENIISQIKKFPCKHIVFTWWEPALFQKQIQDIMIELTKTADQDWFYSTEIETNWSIPLFLKYDQVNVSPKLSNSWNKEYELKVLSEFHDIDYKFVVCDEKDLQEMETYIEKYQLQKENIYLMPMWVSKESQMNKTVFDYCLEKWYRYCQRVHILLFGNKKGV